MKRLVLVCACVLLASPAFAGAIVTWESFGTLGNATWHGFEFSGHVPDPGSPYHLTMSFDPSVVVPTPSSPAGSNCYMLSPVSGSMNLSGYDYTFSAGSGFTHATLPGSNCTPGYPDTMYIIGLHQPADSPYAMSDAYMELWYMDLVNPDGFSSTPNDAFGAFQIHSQSGVYLLNGAIDFQAVDAGGPIDPAPVPEPATMSLLGLGLAAAFRVRRPR